MIAARMLWTVAALAVLLTAAGADQAHAQAAAEAADANYTAGDADGQFRSPEGVAVHRDGTIYVADTGNHRVQVFHPDGTFAFKFGERGSGDGQFESPSGIHWYAFQGPRIAVADTGNHRVQVFYENGTFDFKFGERGSGDGQFESPGDVARWSYLFIVADTGNHRVQFFNSSGAFDSKFGSRGTAHGQFEYPRGVDTPPISFYFAVADTGNDRIQRFQHHPSRDGSYGLNWTVVLDREFPLGANTTADGLFRGPRSYDFDRSGMVADTGNDRIRMLHRNGSLDAAFGQNGTLDATLSSPSDVAGDSRGRVAVADTGNHRVPVFHPEDGTLDFVIGMRSGAGNGTGAGPPQQPPPAAGSGNGTSINPGPGGMLPAAATIRTEDGSASASFRQGTNFTDAATGVPYEGEIGIAAAGDDRRRAILAALAALGVADAGARIGTVVEIGDPGADIGLDAPARILLENQAWPATVHRMNGTGGMAAMPACGSAEDPVGWLENNTAATPFCYAAQGVNVAARSYSLYTYLLSAFFTVALPPPPPAAPADATCSIALDSPSLEMRVAAGGMSPAARQVVTSTGSLDVAGLEIEATPWYVEPAGAYPYPANTSSLPPSLTEMRPAGAGEPGEFMALPSDGAPASVVLPPGGLAKGEGVDLLLRINLGGSPQQGGHLIQHVTYAAECMQP